MQVESHQYSANGYFHNYGIDSIDTTVNRGNWRLRRMQNIMKELGHEGVSSCFISYFLLLFVRVLVSIVMNTLFYDYNILVLDATFF